MARSCFAALNVARIILVALVVAEQACSFVMMPALGRGVIERRWMPASTSAASSSSTSLCMLQGERKKVAVVTGASKGLGLAIGMELLSRGYAVCMGIRGDDPSVLEGRLRLDGYGASDYSVVPNMDVKRVKAISAAAVSIGERFPEGIDVLVNNAAVSPDGFDYDVAGEALDTNFYGSLNMVRRIVPARWSDAVSGKWLPSKVHAGMRAGGVICNIVCGQGEETTRQALRERFSACNSESELVMMLTEYHGLAAYGGDAHLSAGWPSNAYLVSKVALERWTEILSRTTKEFAGGKRYEEGLSCCAVDPGWLETGIGGEGGRVSAVDGAKKVVDEISARLLLGEGEGVSA